MTANILLHTTILTVMGLGPMKSYAAAQGETTEDWTCPSNYEVKSGLNIDFPHKGMKRAFFVYPPADLSKAAPVWVPLTGSVESTRDNLKVARSGRKRIDGGERLYGYGAGSRLRLLTCGR